MCTLDLKQYYNDALGQCGDGKLRATALETAPKLEDNFRAVREEAGHGSGVKQQSSVLPPSQECVSRREMGFPKLKDSGAFICEQMVTHFGFQNIVIL